MALASGTRIGVYEIVSALGEGAMGEVYRARDTKLHREVAIKVLPDAFATDPERLTRFEREAHVLASLNHPHIAQIHGFEESASGCALVMELVEGSTLGEHMAQRAPMPLDEALHIARQIAEALEAAHERGIVHRDLKPANIKIDADGNVKVLDFGLAKGMDAAMSATSDAVSSPTLTAPGTALGLILGTAAYMAPEQAQGKPVDKRADIWSFGVVLYEMLTGRRLFEGQTVTDTLAAVLTRDPEWAPVPERARPLLRRCLERDPKRRLRDIGDARILLEEAQAPARAPRKPNVVWTLAILGIIVAAGLVVALRWPPAVDHPLMRLDVDLGGDAVINPLGAAVLSPDGRRIVFTVRGSGGASVLATRLLDQARVTQLSGTDGAEQPFMSPDGAWIGFFAAGKLKKVSVNGGSPVALADTRNPRGGTWAPDGSIIAALINTTGLSRVPATGGPAEPLTRLEPGEPTHRWPQVLPGGQHVLFTGRSTTFNSFEDASIDVVSLATGDRKTVWRGGYFGRFLPTEGAQGYLVFIRDAVLYGVPFAPDRLEVIGTPVPLLENMASDPGSGAGGFDASTNGLFIYRSGSAPRAWPVVWLDGSGKTRPLLAKPALYYSPRLSPDGQRLAVSIDEGRGMDLFVYDLARDTMSRLTFDGSSNADPVWAPDGKHIVYRSRSGNSWILWWIRSDGAGEPHRLVRTDFHLGNLGAQSFSPDGRVLIYADERPQSDLWTVTLDPPDADRPRVTEPEVLARTGAAETLPAISPDGRWIAYVSNESGVDEVYVRSFRGGPTGKWVLSTGGGFHPLWSRKAPELFFETADGRLMVTTVITRGESFAVTKPRPWSEFRLLSPGFTNLDLAPDGNRFVILPRSPDATPDAYRMTLVVNFFDEIRRRIPSGR